MQVRALATYDVPIASDGSARMFRWKLCFLWRKKLDGSRVGWAYMCLTRGEHGQRGAYYYVYFMFFVFSFVGDLTFWEFNFLGVLVLLHF